MFVFFYLFDVTCTIFQCIFCRWDSTTDEWSNWDERHTEGDKEGAKEKDVQKNQTRHTRTNAARYMFRHVVCTHNRTYLLLRERIGQHNTRRNKWKCNKRYDSNIIVTHLYCHDWPTQRRRFYTREEKEQQNLRFLVEIDAIITNNNNAVRCKVFSKKSPIQFSFSTRILVNVWNLCSGQIVEWMHQLWISWIHQFI